jgi:hypothetical protein
VFLPILRKWKMDQDKEINITSRKGRKRSPASPASPAQLLLDRQGLLPDRGTFPVNG